MDAVAQELQNAQKDLLDLTLRNPLLNYRELRSRGLRIVEADPAAVYGALVRDGGAATFLAEPDVDSMESSLTPPGARTARNGLSLQTPYSEQRLHRRLLNTYYAARSAVEEQGVNLLFLALGMLEWYEADASEELHRAPLILIPVALSRANVRASFKLEYTGDEIDTNLPLQMKLKQDFAIDLPSVPEDPDDIDPAAYNQGVESAIAHRPRWRVDHEAVVLGFFSFHKLLMYKDLDPDNWPAESKPFAHPILRCLLQEGFAEPPPVVGEGGDLDRHVAPDSLYQVCDADSSQTVALLEAAAGRNLVIQGPPGTGKSQTITNLIAGAVARGQTVLFVAEKMAALEVVKRRLDKFGLGAACLELHSHKTNKRAVVAELERTMQLRHAGPAGARPNADELKQLRDRLNGYCRDLHQPIQPSSATPYRAYGVLLKIQDRLEGLACPPLDQMPLGEWTDAAYEERRAVAGQIQTLTAEMGIPEQHPFWGSAKKTLLPGQQAAVAAEAQRARRCLEILRNSEAELARLLGAGPAEGAAELAQRVESARHALTAPDLAGFAVSAPEWRSSYREIERVCSVGRQLAELHSRYDALLRPPAWEADLKATWQTLLEFEGVWWRFLSGRYRRARRELAGLCASGARPSHRESTRIADAILEAQRLQRELDESGALMSGLAGPHWRGAKSDWNSLAAAAAYLNATHRRIEAGELLPETLDLLQRSGSRAELERALRAIEEASENYRLAVHAAFEAAEFDPAVPFGAGGFDAAPFHRHRDLFLTWEREAPRLQQMVTWNHLVERARDGDLGPVVDAAARWPHAGRRLVDLLDHARYTVLLERALRERPALAAFNGPLHAHAVDRFRDLDRELLQLTRRYVSAKHLAGLPPRTGVGQMGVLTMEFAKKRRHRPIRRLVTDAGHAIQRIKPVFMMSPLSVAAYLPPGTARFDLVVFDEASQVRPADAFGAIIRGAQAVVVGDSRQLPPTRFFDRIGAGDETGPDADYSRAADLESILDHFAARGARQVMLRWHYRSRHHSLIAVSNREFYEDKLVVFPCPEFSPPDGAGADRLGLVFHHLSKTAYEPRAAVNRGEAKHVAKAVMRHAKESPHRSLGVAAFSVAQMNAIEDELEILRRRHPECEGFFSGHPTEPFFVKNLENVQGDERDVIFISVGYGRRKDGFVSMHFGPLNLDGGERRLNVLITRARLRCEVFSNLQADDIDLDRTAARGVKALKTFLRYAEHGVLDAPGPVGGEPESPFEEAVGRALERHGYQVHYQVGSAGFRLDLAIVDPDRPGRYLLGVECDGAAYHSARWARDRDRLRQEALEKLGWRIHRIWSTDWFCNPARELDRLRESIAAARSATPAVAADDGDGRKDEPEADPQPDPEPRPPPPPDPPRAQPYRVARLHVHPHWTELHVVPRPTLAGWVEEVVVEESPVHILDVTYRITAAAGVSRAGRRIREAVDEAARWAVYRGRFQRRGDFLWRLDMLTPLVRDRSALPAAWRNIARIAPEEIAEAVLLTVRSAVAMRLEDAVIEASRLLGYAKATGAVRERFNDAVRLLLAEGRLRLDGDFLLIPR